MGSKRTYDAERRAYDFQKCTFEWLWQGPRPPAVVRMVEDRALRSFGPDTVVMQDRWNQPTVTGAVEAKVFPRLPYEDICCADVVGFCAYQTQVCDYLVASNFNRHWVDNYFPFKTKSYGDIAMLVGVYGPPGPDEPKPDESKFLPGDYFIYSRVFDWQSYSNHPHSPRDRIQAGLNGGPTGDNVGDHIDMFLGSFVEVDNGQIVPPAEGGDVYDIINGSWGLGGSSYYVLPYARNDLFAQEWKQGTYVVHCRLKAIDQLYRQLVGPPMRPTPAAIALPQPPPKKGDKKQARPAPPPLDANADLTDFFNRIDGAKAPFPVGTHFGWHQGVHVLQPTPPGPPPAPDPGLHDADQKTVTDANTAYGAAVADAYNGSGEVYPIAPGLIIAARGASPQDMTDGDTGFVLVRHLMSPDAKEVLDPKEVPRAGSAGPGKSPTPFFSLYMHVASLATFTDPAARKDTDAVAPLKEHAPAWLRSLWPKPLPDPSVVHGTALTMLSPKDGDERNGYVVVGKPKNLILPNDVSLARPVKKTTVEGVEYYIVPQWSDPQQAAWVAQPRPPAAIGKLTLFNPRTGKVIPTGQSLDGLAHIEAIADSKGVFHVQVEALDSGNYAHLDAFKRPALRKGGGGTDLSIAEDARPDLPSSPQQVLVLPAKASRGDSWDLMLTTTADGSAVKGPSVTLPWAAIVDADAEAARAKALAEAGEPGDPTHHTTVGAIELKLTDDKHKIGWLWVDLVPCVKTASSKADLESALNNDKQRIAREAQARLTTGVSRLVGAIASSKKDADWTLDGDTYTLTGAGTDKQAPRLYLSLKPHGKDFLVDDSPHGKKADGMWMLAPTEGAGVELHALATATGYGGAHNALVEVLYGVPVSEVDPANQKLIDTAKADNDERVKIINDLLAGKVVDLRQRRSEPLRVGREPIALMGHVVGSPGSGPGPVGLHSEIFAGKPLLLDGDVSLGATLGPIAGTPWLGIADPAEGDLLDAKAARTLVKEAMKLPTFDPQSVLQKNPDGGAGASWAPPADDSAPWQPPSVDEWLAFCSANARLLSRVVTAHPSEWGLDWPESAGKATATHNLQTRDTKDALSRAHKSLKWTDGVAFIADDGLTDPTAIVFHHPARFIELMRTGIEVSVSTHDPGAASKATVTFTPTGKPPVTLAQPPGTPGRFVARISASEVAHDVEQPSLLGVVDVKLDGQAKPFSRQMLITRGVTTRMTVVSAWVEAGMEWAHGGRPFAIDVGERPPPALTDGVIYFLADGGAFGSFGNGSVRLRASLNYNNLSTPAFGDPKLGKDNAGYVVASPKKQIPDSTKKEAPGTQFSSTSASLEFDLVAKVNTLDEANGVSVTVSSDELEKPVTVSWKFSAREIARGMSGPDVAQLQLYLAEILGSDGLPCYRNDVAASGKAGIDGGYGPALRNALWRFCYTYASDQTGSGWAEPNIGFSKSGAIHHVAAADLLAFTNAHHAVVGSAELSKDTDPDVALWAARTQGAATTKANQDDGADWIVVDLPMVQSLVAVFQQGHDVPFIPAELKSKLPPLPAWRADGPAVVFAGKVPDQFNRGLPWPDFHVEATFTEAQPGGGAKDGQVMVEVPADGPYQLRHAGSTSASFTVASSEVFSSSGLKCELVPVAGAKKIDKVTMKASWVAGKKWLMSQHALVPPRNFAQKYEGKDDSGMDVALVQICLSQAPAKNADSTNAVPVGFFPAPSAPPKPKPPPKGATTPPAPPKGIVTIDGVWSAAWVGALQRYAVEWGLAAKGKSIDSDTVVPTLLAHVLRGSSP